MIDNFQDLVKQETLPKHKTFFGKLFDPSGVAKKFSIHAVPQYKLFCGIEKHDKGLYIPELSRVWEGHSLLANWYNQLRSVTFAIDGNDGTDWLDGYINFRIYTGNVTSQNYPIVWSAVNHYVIGAGIGYNGVMLGTGSTAVTERDYSLDTAVTHGNTAGKINYGATTANVTYDSTNKIWQEDLSRAFTGNAVDAVTVAEMALGLRVYNTQDIVTARDLVSPTEEVGIAEVVNFHYIVQQVNPA